MIKAVETIGAYSRPQPVKLLLLCERVLGDRHPPPVLEMWPALVGCLYIADDLSLGQNVNLVAVEDLGGLACGVERLVGLVRHQRVFLVAGDALARGLKI